MTNDNQMPSNLNHPFESYYLPFTCATNSLEIVNDQSFDLRGGVNK